MSAESFAAEERQALYRVLAARRDVRHFRPDTLPPDVLRRILEAAHLAPSVGFMQPWNFILIASADVRRRVRASFEERNRAELENVPTPQRQAYFSPAPLRADGTCSDFLVLRKGDRLTDIGSERP